MFRLVLIHQLVLAVLVGPMLCCCTAARLGHDASAGQRSDAQSGRKTCCGGRDSSASGSHSPGEQRPSEPAKCPCKDGPAKVAAVPEAPASTADAMTLLTAGIVTLELPMGLDATLRVARSAPRFVNRSSSLSTADLLFAHHNLRC